MAKERKYVSLRPSDATEGALLNDEDVEVKQARRHFPEASPSSWKP